MPVRCTLYCNKLSERVVSVVGLVWQMWSSRRRLDVYSTSLSFAPCSTWRRWQNAAVKPRSNSTLIRDHTENAATTDSSRSVSHLVISYVVWTIAKTAWKQDIINTRALLWQRKPRDAFWHRWKADEGQHAPSNAGLKSKVSEQKH